MSKSVTSHFFSILAIYIPANTKVKIFLVFKKGLSPTEEYQKNRNSGFTIIPDSSIIYTMKWNVRFHGVIFQFILLTGKYFVII